MKRKLLTQMGNEWQSNVWLGIELLIVSVVLWYIVDAMVVKLTVYNEPLGFEYDHCYRIYFSELNEKSPDYVKKGKDEEYADFMAFLDRIGNRKEIEAVGAGQNSVMYNGSNSGVALSIDSLSSGETYVIQRRVTPDFVKVFRYRGINGESPEEMAQALKDNPTGFYASNNVLSDAGVKDLREYVGRTFECSGGRYREITLQGVLETVRYGDHVEALFNKSILQPMPYGWTGDEIAVRVKENMDKDFIENFMKDANDMRTGNYFITKVVGYEDLRESFNRAEDRGLRALLIGMTFLMFNVFLGLLGTFWFKTQQRAEEIAIRRVNGATATSIFRRIITEGLLLLTIVTPFALGIDYLLTAYEINTYSPYDQSHFNISRFLGCAAIVYALISLMIVLGTYYPAMRAVKIQPARVLAEN